jgi:hypothetical protein
LPENILRLLTQAKDWYYPIQTAWFDKVTLPPIRIFLSGLWFAALLVLFRSYEARIARLLGGMFLRFGQNSLLVYVAHGFILFPSFLFLPGDTNFWVNNLIDVVVLSGVYLVVIWHKQFLEAITKIFLELLVTLGIVRLDLLGDGAEPED